MSSANILRIWLTTAVDRRGWMCATMAALPRNQQLIRGGRSTSRNQRTSEECSWPIRTVTVRLSLSFSVDSVCLQFTHILLISILYSYTHLQHRKVKYVSFSRVWYSDKHMATIMRNKHTYYSLCRLQGTDRVTLSLAWPMWTQKFVHPCWGATRYAVNITALYVTATQSLFLARMSTMVYIGSDMSSFNFRWSTTRWMSAKLKCSHLVRFH